MKQYLILFYLVALPAWAIQGQLEITSGASIQIDTRELRSGPIEVNHLYRSPLQTFLFGRPTLSLQQNDVSGEIKVEHVPRDQFSMIKSLKPSGQSFGLKGQIETLSSRGQQEPATKSCTYFGACLGCGLTVMGTYSCIPAMRYDCEGKQQVVEDVIYANTKTTIQIFDLKSQDTLGIIHLPEQVIRKVERTTSVTECK